MIAKPLLQTVIGVLLFVSSSPTLRPQGFGTLSRETVILHRKLPAIFSLTGTNISVKVKATAVSANALPVPLTSLIETMLQQSDNRVVVDDSKPQTLIFCTITGYIPPRIQNLTRTVTTSNNKKIFSTQSQQQQQPYKKVTGELSISYRATDLRTHKTLDAAVLETKINTDYEANGSKTSSFGESLSNLRKMPGSIMKKHEAEEAIPGNTEEVNVQMMNRIASDLAKRVVTTDEPVTVLLAKGKLDHAGKLGESGLWPRMLEELESMQPFAKPTDEAYRLYDLGVAYEAMGYGAPNNKQALKLFEQAAIDYGKAIDDNPEEKYFREPQTRIENALVVMKTLDDRAKGIMLPTEDVSTELPMSVPPEPQAKPAVASASTVSSALDSNTLTNDAIIELAKSGMNDENLIANIREAKDVKFDLTLVGQKQLMHSGVSNAVLTAMRQKLNGPVPHKNSASPATPKPGTQAK